MLLFLPMSAVFETENDGGLAFMEGLYSKYRLLMLKTAWAYTKDKEDIRDILSQACVALYEKIPLLRTLEESALRVYIAKTVRSAAVNCVMLRRRELCVPTDFYEKEEARFLTDPDITEKKVLLKDEMERMINAISRLPDLQRDLLYLRMKGDKTYEEIASLYGITSECARKTVERARKRLKEEVYGGNKP